MGNTFAVEVERFGEKILGVHGGGPLGDVAGERAHEDDRDLFGGRLAMQDFADGKAVEIRQQDVQEDEVGLVLPRLAQGMDAVAGREKFTRQIAQAEFHQLDEIALVVHYEDAW